MVLVSADLLLVVDVQLLFFVSLVPFRFCCLLFFQFLGGPNCSNMTIYGHKHSYLLADLHETNNTVPMQWLLQQERTVQLYMYTMYTLSAPCHQPNGLLFLTGNSYWAHVCNGKCRWRALVIWPASHSQQVWTGIWLLVLWRCWFFIVWLFASSGWRMKELRRRKLAVTSLPLLWHWPVWVSYLHHSSDYDSDVPCMLVASNWLVYHTLLCSHLYNITRSHIGSVTHTYNLFPFATPALTLFCDCFRLPPLPLHRVLCLVRAEQPVLPPRLLNPNLSPSRPNPSLAVMTSWV